MPVTFTYLDIVTEYLKDTILNGYKIWRFEDPHVWLVQILAILGQLRV